MVTVGFRETEREHPNGASIQEDGGLLKIYGAEEPDPVLIALYQTWDHAEVVIESTDDGE